MSLLGIEGMHFHAYHGFYHEEKIIGTNFMVDVYIDADLNKAGESDQIKDTVNYENIYSICKMVMQERFDLIEKVAGQIISEIIKIVPAQTKVKVRIRKLNPPMPGKVDSTFIELSSI